MCTRLSGPRRAALVLGLLGIAGCGALKLDLADSATSSTPPAPTCAATDGACFQKNLRLVEQGGSDIELVTIAGALPAATAIPGGAPMVTDVILANAAATMTIGSTTGSTPLWLAFSDPLGSRPAFCMQTCPKNAKCAAGYRCTRSFKDGLISGVYKTWLGYKAEPVDSTTTADLQLQITPISTPDGSDPIAQFEAIESAGGDISQLGPDQVVVGEPVTVEQTVSKAADDDDDDAQDNSDDDDSDDDTSGNAAEGTACTADSQCQGDCFTTRSCVKGISCSCAGVATPGVCYNVVCEKAGGTCGDGKGCCVGLTCTNAQCVSSATSGCF